jgi:hypothetical protein
MSDKVFVKLREPQAGKTSRQKPEGRAKRFLCSEMVQLVWSGPDGLPHREIAVLENLSKASAGLFMGVQVPCGIKAQLLVSDAHFTGHIRQCAFTGNGYIVDLKFESPTKPAGLPGEGFVPEHLLDVSLLDLD